MRILVAVAVVERAVRDAGRLDPHRLHGHEPAGGSSAALRLNAPLNVQVEGVRIGRSVRGPGYFARTATQDLEALDTAGTRDGVFEHSATGSWVELGLRCPSAGCDMTGAALDFFSLALVVRDDSAPSFSLGNFPAYAAGATELVVDAHDTGIGLASARATLAGVPVGAALLGDAACRELSPGDAIADLPLSDGCPGARRIGLVVDSTLVADGTHRLEVTVTDGAGNVSVQGAALEVVNHPPVTATPTPFPRHTPVPRATPTPVPSQAVLTPAKRYAINRRGELTAGASCSLRAVSNCPVSLTLRAKLPGRKRTAAIASARTSFRPARRSS